LFQQRIADCSGLAAAEQTGRAHQRRKKGGKDEEPLRLPRTVMEDASRCSAVRATAVHIHRAATEERSGNAKKANPVDSQRATSTRTAPPHCHNCFICVVALCCPLRCGVFSAPGPCVEGRQQQQRRQSAAVQQWASAVMSAEQLYDEVRIAYTWPASGAAASCAVAHVARLRWSASLEFFCPALCLCSSAITSDRSWMMKGQTKENTRAQKA
jgi:hypothetical protein